MSTHHHTPSTRPSTSTPVRSRAGAVAALTLAVALAGCSVITGDPIGDESSPAATSTTTGPPPPTTTSTATTSTTSTATTSTSTASTAGVVQLALTIHVERHDSEMTDDAEFDAHLALLDQLEDVADSHGVILNFELSTEFVQAVDRWGSTFVEDALARGNGISQHSGDQSTAGLTGAALTAELVRQRAAIEAHGADVRYVSGGCSADAGWVESAIDAGFTAVTGITEYCLSSLDDASLPAGMDWIRRCTNPGVCHDPLHIQTERVLHPWTTSTSSDWLTDDPSGRLVLVSAAEVDGLSAMSQTGDADLATSLAQWQMLLDDATAAAVPGQVNVLNFVLSVGPEPDWEVLDALFTAADARVAAGQVAWADLGTVVSAAAAEAPTQPADAAVVYSDTTPDLGGGMGNGRP